MLWQTRDIARAKRPSMTQYSTDLYSVAAGETDQRVEHKPHSAKAEKRPSAPAASSRRNANLCLAPTNKIVRTPSTRKANRTKLSAPASSAENRTSLEMLQTELAARISTQAR